MSTNNNTVSSDKTNQDKNNAAVATANNVLNVDATGATISSQQNDEARSAARHQNTKSPERHYLTKLMFLVLLLLAAGATYLWFMQSKTLGELSGQNQLQVESQQKFNEALQNQSGTLSALDTNQQALQTNIQTLGADQQQLSRAFRDLLNANRHLKQDWLISEAEYLVNLAGQRLSLMRDVKTAITALAAADNRLRETGNPQLIEIRKALAKDINDLESLQQVDITGLSLKLSAMLSDIDQLKLLTPKPDDAILEAQPKESSEISNWTDLPAAMWRDIKKLVVIREHQGPIKPLLSPEQFFFLSQNLKLQLEQARLAMLSGESRIYTERLTTAIAWIEKWFDPQDRNTRKLLTKLTELKKHNIHPVLPTLNNSFAAFKHYRKNLKLPESVKSELKSKPQKSKKKTVTKKETDAKNLVQQKPEKQKPKPKIAQPQNKGTAKPQPKPNPGKPKTAPTLPEKTEQISL